jgi:hypothetical protein
MRSLRLTLIVIVALTTLGAERTVHAGVDVSFGAHVALNDSTDLYLSISSRYFDRDRATVDRWGARYNNPDDLAVALFISRHTDQPLDVLWALYQQRGLSWWEISVRYGMPVDVWFVEVERAPGPPYGNAYGHWKKHRKPGHGPMTLTDADLRNLVAVRMAHEYYGVSVDVAMDWRSDGRNLSQVMCDEYERRHGNPQTARHAAVDGRSGPGHGNGKGHKKK